MCVENWKENRYPKLSLHEECALETSEKVKSGMGSMGWKKAWCVWEEWGATAPPTELGKQEEEEDKEERDWGFRLEEQMMEGWDTAEERGGRGRHSSCPNDWLRDCLRVALDLGGCGVPSPCCPANRQLSTNLWEPMASWGSMWRWRRDIILGAVGKKQQHYQQPLMIQSDGQGEADWEISGKILRCWDTFLLKLTNLKLGILLKSMRYITFTNLAFILIALRKSQRSWFISPYKKNYLIKQKQKTVIGLPTMISLTILNNNEPIYNNTKWEITMGRNQGCTGWWWDLGGRKCGKQATKARSGVFLDERSME